LQGAPPTRLARLLVASDGEVPADAALKIAGQLAARDGADVDVVAIVAPRFPAPRDGHATPRYELRIRTLVVELRARVERQLYRIGVEWRVHCRVGNPAWAIADLARRSHADLVLVGHPTAGEGGLRRPGRHTPEQVACACDVPVLSVRTSLDRVPTTAVTLADGGAASRVAERLSRALVGDGGTVHPVLDLDLVAVPLIGPDFQVRSLMSGSVIHVLDHVACSMLIAPSPADSGERKP
jgi:nucleotide-binding universal stress UspA family protein